MENLKKVNIKLAEGEKSKLLDITLNTKAVIRVGVNKAGNNYAMLSLTASSKEIGIEVSPDPTFLDDSEFFALTGEKLK